MSRIFISHVRKCAWNSTPIPTERDCRAAAFPASLQGLLPRFGNELIAGAAAHEMSEAGEVQVHAGDHQPIGRHHVEHAPARDRRGGANRLHRPPYGLAFRSPGNRPCVLGYLQLLYPPSFDTSVYNECLAILARHLEAIEDTRVPDCLPVLRLAPAIKIISRTIGKIFDRLYAVLTKGDEHWRRYAWNILQTVINAKLLSLSIKIHLHVARWVYFVGFMRVSGCNRIVT